MIKKIMFFVLALSFMVLTIPTVQVHASSGSAISSEDKGLINNIVNGSTATGQLDNAEASVSSMGGSIYGLIRTIAIVVGLITIAAGGIGVIFANNGKIKEAAWGAIGKVLVGILILSAAAFIVSIAMQLGGSFK